DLRPRTGLLPAATACSRWLRDGDRRTGAGPVRGAHLVDRRRRRAAGAGSGRPGVRGAAPHQAGAGRRARHGDHRHHRRAHRHRAVHRARRGGAQPAQQRVRSGPAGVPARGRHGRGGPGAVSARLRGGPGEL
ncbi:MAG: hypothetical protein AVDCRST_MAG36-1546, partial [uncultured Nocardioidaceae bacterium]